MSHIHQLRFAYWGTAASKGQLLSSYGGQSIHLQDTAHDSQPTTEASSVGRSWVQSMFSRDTSIRAQSFTRVRSGLSGIPNYVQELFITLIILFDTIAYY